MAGSQAWAKAPALPGPARTALAISCCERAPPAPCSMRTMPLRPAPPPRAAAGSAWHGGNWQFSFFVLINKPARSGLYTVHAPSERLSHGAGTVPGFQTVPGATQRRPPRASRRPEPGRRRRRCRAAATPRRGHAAPKPPRALATRRPAAVAAHAAEHAAGRAHRSA